MRTSDIICPCREGRRYVSAKLILRRRTSDTAFAEFLSYGMLVTNGSHTFDVYRYNDLARILGRSRRTLYKWRKEGLVPAPLNSFTFPFGRYKKPVLWIYRNQMILFVHLYNYLQLYDTPTFQGTEFFYLVGKLWRSCIFFEETHALYSNIELVADIRDRTARK